MTPARALAAYLAITIAATWPLAAGLGRDVPWDLGDSILNIWILAWDGEQIRAILRGDVSRIGSFFDANIFHPAPLTLAYSEHLIAQAIQIFPVYVLTGNPILCYNLLFLSTFVLSGLGMFLFVRELTGNSTAAFVAGLVFAFVPYRLPQSAHLQVLSSHWMPFVLYGLRRHFDTRRLRPLVGAAVALVAQNLSCGYYLLYFSPVVAAYGLWEIWRRGLWRDRTMWLRMAGAAVFVLVVTLPFLLPYAELRRAWGETRARAEVLRFAADTYSYLTSFSGQRIWGDLLQTYPKPEGELFPGLVPIVLAVVGMGLAPAAALAPLLGAVFLRRTSLDLWLFTVRITDINRMLVIAAALLVLVLVTRPAVRAWFIRFMRERGFFVLVALAAAWLSLGLEPRSMGRRLDLVAPYAWLFEFIPGFDGLRAPARFAMIVMLMTAVLAGFGAAAIAARRYGHSVLAFLCVLFLIEATHVPFTVNGMTPLTTHATPEGRLYRPARAPAVYNEAAQLPPDAVLVELPLGVPDYDLRAVYYSIVHGRPLLNGYSGFFPAHYGQLTTALTEVPRHPELSLGVLRAAGATHAIVHEAAFPGSEGAATSDALRQLGATELYRDGTDVLLALPPP